MIHKSQFRSIAERRAKIITFADHKFYRLAQNFAHSAETLGIKTHIFTPESELFQGTPLGKDIKWAARGAGFYAWKPFIIEYALRNFDSEFIIYLDCGREMYQNLYLMSRLPDSLLHSFDLSASCIQLMPETKVFGPLKRWTRRSCLNQMQAFDLASEPVIQSGWSIWKKSALDSEILNKWKTFSLIDSCISDPISRNETESDDFIDHRHDQSILTILAHQNPTEHKRLHFPILDRIAALRQKSFVAQRLYASIQHVDYYFQHRNVINMIARVYNGRPSS